MRSADAILITVRERGERGLPLRDIYRMLYNRELFLRAYAKLYPNKGALTKGVTAETVDGMSLAKIDHLINELRYERFKWTPARRTYIPKKNGSRRPLGIPTWRNKIVQEVVRTILETYYEPQFSNNAHGFRPKRGCHTALRTIQAEWSGTQWFIEGDISQYFDTINHDTLINILGEKLHDNRLLQLLRGLLQAGYLEEWQYHRTYSGTPQGGVISPLLANIYLDRFDQYIENVLQAAHTKGKRRTINPTYRAVQRRALRARKEGRRTEAKELRKQQQQLPYGNPTDPNFRRLRYIRYADDWLIGFSGPKHEAEDIKRQIKEWLSTNLKLNLSEEKTLLTHARHQAARFLGYEIVNLHENSKHDFRGQRCINGGIGLRVPREVIDARCTRYIREGKPKHRPELLEQSDYTIITQYQQEYRGIVQYYQLAYNVSRWTKLHWVMKASLLKTLANKHKTRVSVIIRKYNASTQTSDGTRYKCLKAIVERKDKQPLVAQFGGIPLKRQPWATLADELPKPVRRRTEILKRLLNNECELCGSTEDIQVHHIRHLKDLRRTDGRERPPWVQRMAALRRKTLVVCHDCHINIHAGRPTQTRQNA